MPVTLRDIAKAANVSSSTVSRVLNNQDGFFVSDSTRERILSISESLGYRPNRAARALATGCTHVISVLAKLESPFYVKVVNCLGKILYDQGYSILVSNVSESQGILASAFGLVDGVIAVDCPAVDDYVSAHQGLQLPFISIGSYRAHNLDYVTVDLYSPTRKVLDHLISMGRRRIIYVCPDGYQGSLDDERQSAYIDRMGEAGLHPEFIGVALDLRTEARKAIRNYIEKSGFPDAILCHNDDKAIGVYRGLRDMGMRIPDDVALVGCDGIEDVNFLDCEISSIVQPVEAMCKSGWNFLRNRMADHSMPVQQVVLESEYVIRESSRVGEISR